MERLCNLEQGQKLAVSPWYNGSNAPNYQNQMEVNLSMFWDFLSMIADYQSMIILLPWPPKNAPCVNSDSIRKYVDYKFLDRGEKLLCDAKPVKTYKFSSPRRGKNIAKLSTQMECVGTCHNPDSFKIFFAALKQVHENNDITGSFVPFWENCRMHFYGVRGFLKTDCTHGPTYHNYVCRGNPTRHRHIKDKKKEIEIIAANRGYNSTSKSPLFPSDINDFANYVRDMNYGNNEFGFFISSLAGVKFALRYQGFSHLGYHSF